MNSTLKFNATIINSYDDLFSSLLDGWLSDELAQLNKNDQLNINIQSTFFYEYDTNVSIDVSHFLTLKSAPPAATSASSSKNSCALFYSALRKNNEPLINTLNLINYFIITIGILFNILNVYVLLNSKLNESPYTYLTMLAMSDLGALAMLAFEKLRQTLPKYVQFNYYDESFIYIITPLINMFLSCSMYITLALTIERFIFVQSPFKAITLCRKSTARRVCLCVFVFSLLRCVYLPFMYERNECVPRGWIQKPRRSVDIYEFVVSLAIPYTLIFVINLSLLFSLKKRNYITIVSKNYSTANLVNKTINNNMNSKPPTNNEQDPMLKQDNNYNAILPINKNENNKNVQSLTENELKKPLNNNNDNNRQQDSSNTKPSFLYHRTSNNREMRNHKKLTRSLIMILCFLLICYFPSFLFEESLADFIFGASLFDQSSESARVFKIKAVGYRVSLIFIYVNCSFNFLIYCASNKKFKNSLRLLMRKSFAYKQIYLRVCYFLMSDWSFLKSVKLPGHLNRAGNNVVISYKLNRVRITNVQLHDMVIGLSPTSRTTLVSARLTNSLRTSENNFFIKS